MRKKILISSLAFFGLSIWLTASSLFALEPYEQIYMTSGNGNITEKSVPYAYTLDEQPWLYLQLKNQAYTDTIGTSNSTSVWTWDNPSGPDEPYLRKHDDTKNGMWVSFDGAEYSWDEIKQLGTWSITANTDLIVPGGLSTAIQKYSGSASFQVNVVPEPASMLLYILGGGSLLAGFFRKKK